MKTTTREQIVYEADVLFYTQGFEKTSLSDIANKLEISKGNFYHHFKSKDEILSAVIDLRLNNTKQMLDQWQKNAQSPQERILCFVHILIENFAKIKNYGCPVGSLCLELSKLDHSSREDANRVLSMFADWLTQQFEEMGFRSNARKYAMHVLARSQGVAILASAYQDEELVAYEVKLITKWLKDLKHKN